MADSKTIVITGATRGLGAALTEEFIDRGHVVIACGRSRERIDLIQERWGKPHVFSVVDVAVASQVENWGRSTLAEGQTPDILINNAGVINDPAPLWKVPEEDFSRLIDVNIKGVFYCLRAFLPAMVAKGTGTVVNLSSGWGRSVSPGVGPYCGSKYAVEGMSKALADEVPTGMAVVPLNPGVIDTEMLRRCFGESAGGHVKPEAWAGKAAKLILGLGPADNGQSLSV